MISDRKKLIEQKNLLVKKWKAVDREAAALAIANAGYEYAMVYSRSKKKKVKRKVKKKATNSSGAA